MIETLANLLTLFGIQPEQIRPNNLRYLTRWRLVESKLFGVYLHRFDASDPDPSKLHSHPWSGVAILLRGRYLEARSANDDHTVIDWRVRRWGSVLRPTTWHRVELIEGAQTPVWTLLVRGPRSGTWSFVEPRQWRIKRAPTQLELFPNNSYEAK